MEKINVSQIGQSACGPTSVLNILAALDFTPLPSPENLLQFFPARLRDYKTKSISKYLYSRAVAGTIHEEIIETTEKISENKRDILSNPPLHQCRTSYIFHYSYPLYKRSIIYLTSPLNSPQRPRRRLRREPVLSVRYSDYSSFLSCSVQHTKHHFAANRNRVN